ncbi:MAG: hypothetical protein ACQERD_00810 [Campylobacterota bacterium]
MREPWQVYLMMFFVIAFIMLGKKMMISDDSKSHKKPKDKDKK